MTLRILIACETSGITTQEQTMSDPRETLKSHITAVIEGLRYLDVDSAADLIAEVANDLAEGGPEDLFNGALLDGIRWGYAAAVQVEMAGGAMLRVVLPGGVGITHQWVEEATAQPQIRAALASLHTARVSANGGWGTSGPEQIISDEEVERVHGYDNFGDMTPREVLAEGVLKYAYGYTSGYTQLTILLEHGLIRKPKPGGYHSTLTKRGQKYLRAAWPIHNTLAKIKETNHE